MITSKIIADSIYREARITTFELEYPRFIHSEFMTHRMFSRNCASSRAIPIATVLKHIKDAPAAPIHWGRNESGMQANTELTGLDLLAAKSLWDRAMTQSLMYAAELGNLGAHKQIVNRITEPYQHMKTVVTATEWDNWFELRNHNDAQPEIHELAFLMAIDMRNSNPVELELGEWHVPYVIRRAVPERIFYIDLNGTELTLEQALRISASCCAQVSYRKTDDSIEKATHVYNRLVSMNPKHSSPFEHQATPIDIEDAEVWLPGVTHLDKEGVQWSANFSNWIQYRQVM